MASYYPSFNYKGLNSYKDKKLIVVAFEPDNGEVDTFLGMDAIYTDKFDGSRRLDYGAKFNNVSRIKISVIKSNQTDFTVAEVRDFLRWTTGSRQVSYLDMLVGDEVKFCFLGRVVNAYQQKLDARTIGLSIEFESVSPWAYSPVQTIKCAFDDALRIDDAGVVYKKNAPMSINSNGVLNNGAYSAYSSGLFRITDDGVIYIDNTITIHVDNQSDDAYSFVEMDAVFENQNCTYMSIVNQMLDEVVRDETIVKSLTNGEVITLSSSQFITSSSGRTFGENFNFVWPRLYPGDNVIVVSGDGEGSVELTYRYPIKIGDCTLDPGDYGDIAGCDGYNYDDADNGSGNSK